MYYPNSNDWWLDPSQGRFDIRANGAAAPLASLQADGRFGIGTASPQVALHVKGAFGTGAADGFYVENTSLARFFRAGWGASYPRLIGDVGLGLAPADNNTDSIFINSAGSVGLGTTSPSARLDVAGSYYSRLVNGGNSGAAVTIDWNLGNVQFLTLTGNAALTFTNGQSGARYVLVLKQGGGGNTVTWPASARWSGGAAPVLTAAAGKTDYVAFIYNGVDGKYDGVGFNSNF